MTITAILAFINITLLAIYALILLGIALLSPVITMRERHMAITMAIILLSGYAICSGRMILTTL